MQEAVADNRNRYARYNATRAGQYRRRSYRRGNSKWTTDAKYLSKQFIGWDGEGVTMPDGSHRYVLLANSLGEFIVDEDGLSTEACYRFLLDTATANPNCIHVIYGGGYDFNCWMADYTADQLRAVYARKFVKVKHYQLDWLRGKSFWIKDLKTLQKIKVYDVVSFFQCSFVNACDSYLGVDFVDRELIVENKEARSAFKVENLVEIMQYNDAELVNLVRLMNELRVRLNKVGLRPARWDGPGAIAAALLTREGVKSAQHPTPPEVAQASRFAFAGGRFEVLRFGDVQAPAYEYDVNSAYPAALLQVPNLHLGHWERWSGAKAMSEPIQPYALYHVRYSGNLVEVPSPLFHRAPNGAIFYPTQAHNWAWSPEVSVGIEYVKQYGGSYDCEEAYVYVEDDPTNKPFAFIDPLYKKRQALKAGKDGAHVGLKLGLNSMFGKTAQQVGWSYTVKGKLRIPPFHQLEWAGFVTSHCRATVLGACLTDLDSVLAFETDAVFTTKPLPVKVGTNLGEWEATEFTSLTYVQSGTYFGTLADGSEVTKSRGVDLGYLTLPKVRKAMGCAYADKRYVPAKLTRFVGAGVALSQNFDRWRHWEIIDKKVSVEPMGKRLHSICPACGPKGIKRGDWHLTFCPYMPDGHSTEFPIAWINPNPKMILDDLREESYDDWDD